MATSAKPKGKPGSHSKVPTRKSAAKRVVAKRQTRAISPSATHTQHEDQPWTINIPGHVSRTASPIYEQSRALLKAIVSEAADWASFLGGKPSYQDHHGGGLWVLDSSGWLFLKNIAGIEWSQQFCADPSKIDKLRINAKRIYAAFPKTIPALQKLMKSSGKPYPFQEILETPIKGASDVARWVDSIFNASVPLDVQRHTTALNHYKGTPPSAPGTEVGVHHYPTPITDVQLFKYDDFQLWVVDDEGQPAAVTPAHPRGSGRSEVNVAYATPGTKLHDQLTQRRRKEEALQLKGSHPIAQQAFAAQVAKPLRQ